MKRKITIPQLFIYTFSTIFIIFNNQNLFSSSPNSVHAISIKPADFDRLIMPCYLGGSFVTSSSNSYGAVNPSIPSSSAAAAAQTNSFPSSSSAIISSGYAASNGYPNQASRLNGGSNGQSMNLGTNGAGQNLPYQPTYYGVDSSRSPSSSLYSQNNRDNSLSNLGQQVPRANTIDNFIALVSKIEVANPRLANNPDQLIRTLLSRFRMDNYYYDVRSKMPISEQDHRTLDLIPAILNPFNQQQQQQTQMPFVLSSDIFPEHLLDYDEKCSMYYMLSHFIDKSTPSSPSLANLPVVQLTGANGGQKPPVLQAAGTGYPAQSANNAFNGNGNTGTGSYRYPGPSPSFGSPATSNMNSFGAGISNTPEYTGNNPYGMNVLQQNNQFNQNYNNLRNTGQYSGTLASNSRYSTPYIDGGGRSRMNERQALEYGVVTVANQENAAIVLNRVLMGILAAPMTPLPIRQLSSIIYPTQNILSNALKIDEDIDPLFAVTLADLWAVGAIPKAGKGVDPTLLGDNGHWNDTMCPTSFLLDRASSIRFTTAELLGGLDGFNLGMFRRRLLSMRRNIRLSEILKMYYSKTGFRPQFAEVGVCNRGSGIMTQLDDMRRQAENYLRLYQLNTPISDMEITGLITRLESFKELLRQAANQYTPQNICQDSSYTDSSYPSNQQDQCEIPKADVSIVLDSSPKSNDAFMNLFVAKFAQKLGLSRQGNSLSVLTNQQDMTGYAGAYSFNAIVRNSTNTAEIGCALVHDTSRSYQGGQITDPTRLVEMFERALINLDSEYLVRQNTGGLPSASNKQSSYISTLFGQSTDNLFVTTGAGPSNTGGAKVIIWFNYGSQQKPLPIAASPTNWNTQSYNDQYKFNEAKRYLRENFRGASVLAVASSREDVKAFVYDEERDIFTDIPQGSSTASPYDYSIADQTNLATLNDPADQLVSKLLRRMCDIPALFQYPMCFRTPSDNTQAVGYISPGKKQYWMMSPKTFFASHTVRMAFKVEGGRLRVCFGRMSKPDESAYKYQQQYPSSITFNTSPTTSNGQVLPSAARTSSSNDYYTGLNYGICKDVSPGQEIDFIVDDPCYKKPIAECEPFYYVLNEISNIGEGDPNYMCKEEGCKRFDQVKFIMTHSGVTCSSAFKATKANWLLIVVSVLTSLCVTQDIKSIRSKITSITSKANLIVVFVSATFCFMLQRVQAQQAGVHDFGQGRYGEKRGNFTPSEILAIILLVMTIFSGLALTIGLCYYVTKRNSRGMTRVEQQEY